MVYHWQRACLCRAHRNGPVGSAAVSEAARLSRCPVNLIGLPGGRMEMSVRPPLCFRHAAGHRRRKRTGKPTAPQGAPTAWMGANQALQCPRHELSDLRTIFQNPLYKSAEIGYNKTNSHQNPVSGDGCRSVCRAQNRAQAVGKIKEENWNRVKDCKETCGVRRESP